MSKDSENQQSIDIAEISFIMKIEQVRNFMNKILVVANVDGSVFSNDPYKHAYNSGWRDLGSFIEQKLKEADPGNYVQMKREAIDEQ